MHFRMHGHPKNRDYFQLWKFNNYLVLVIKYRVRNLKMYFIYPNILGEKYKY